MFDCENQYGEIAPQQEKALEALGFELPEPDKPVGRKNNRKITFDSACRVLLFDVAKKHGLQLEEEPEYGGRAYLEKQDYILFKQKRSNWQHWRRKNSRKIECGSSGGRPMTRPLLKETETHKEY